MNALRHIRARHGAAWADDPWYERAWLIWPQAVGIALIVWLNGPDSNPPEMPSSEAGWVHPINNRAQIKALTALRSQARTDPHAQDLLLERAKAGDKAAQFFAGTLFDPSLERADASPERTAQAIAWYRRAAEQNVASAQANLGILLSQGQYGIPTDYPEAYRWLSRAAQVMPAAQRSLGLLYRNGLGVPVDIGKGMELIRTAADRGDAAAQAILADALDHGALGLTADPREAALLFQKAALGNNVAAARELAIRLQGGRGIPADHDKARYWFKRAAAAGDAYSKAQVAASEAK